MSETAPRESSTPAPEQARGTAPGHDTAAPAHARPDPRPADGTRATGGSESSGPRVSTSAAAVFALVFGLIGFLTSLTGLLAPVAIVLGVIGLILGIVGIKAGKKPLKAGRGTAIGGTVLSVLALLLGIAAIVGAASVISSNPQILDQISNLVNSARARVGA